MNRPLTTQELEYLKSSPNLTFCYNEIIYTCDLRSFPIEQAASWVVKAKNKRQSDKCKAIQIWLSVAKKYQQLVDFFYPKLVSKQVNKIVEYLLNSNALDQETCEDAEEHLRLFWVSRAEVDPYYLTLSEIIDTGRVLKKLNIETLNYREFVDVFDMETYTGCSSSTFNVLFTFLRKASTNPHWTYNSRDWPLIESAIGQWRKCMISFEKVEVLLKKYLDIQFIHPFFKEYIWEDLTKLIDINSEYYKAKYTSCQLLIDQLRIDYEQQFKVLDIEPSTPYDKAKQVYRNLLWIYHPDTSDNIEGEEMKELGTAWALLEEYYEKVNLL